MKIKHVFGNVLRIDIPLTIKIRTIEGGVPMEREEPFYPNLDMPVTVELANNYNTRVLYDATVYENVAHIEDNGLIRVGDYKVTVKCFDDSGNPYRYMVRDIVEIVDATIDADIEAGIEFDAETHTLEGAVFISYQSSGFEQVQADWEETNVNSKSYIRHKPNLTQYATKGELAVVEGKIPTLPDNIVTDPNYVHTDNNFSNEEKQKLSTLENYDDTGVKGLINTEKQRAESVEEGLSTSINNIGRVIPAQASQQNQLADKEFVNHSIATNTANFKGTYNSVAELSNITDATNNDYAFVIVTDAQGNQFYDRYKYNGTTWLYEYRVESTAFTAQQWAAIQSGITSALVAKLSDLPTNEALQEALTLINTTLSGKQDTISDLSEIRSGASAGATAYQKPQGGIPASDIAPNVIPDVSNREKRTAIVASYNTQDPSQPVTGVSCNLSTYYRIPVPVESLTLMLPPNPQSGYVENIVVFLTGGTSPSVQIMSEDINPAPIYYHDGYAIESGKTYELNILWNGAAWVVASVEIVINN